LLRSIESHAITVAGNFRWPFACFCVGHAAPLAIRTKGIPDRKIFSVCSTRDGGVDHGLRRRRRKHIRAPASTSSICHRDDFTEEWIGNARECDGVFREGDEHDGYGRELERE
jgi:hypothetical protein